MEVHGLNGAAMISALKLSDSSNNKTKCILLATNNNAQIANSKQDFLLLKNSELMPSLNKAVQSILSI